MGEKLRQQIMGETIKSHDRDIEDYYKENAASLKEPEKRHLRQHALFHGRRCLEGQIEAGDMNTNGQGGDLGWIAPGVIAPAFEDVFFKPGEERLVDSVLIPSGWNIIKVKEIKAARQPQLGEVKDKIRNLLLEERAAKALSNWLDQVA